MLPQVLFPVYFLISVAQLRVLVGNSSCIRARKKGTLRQDPTCRISAAIAPVPHTNTSNR